MADFIESARKVLSASERRMETTAGNVANLTTPGFKAERLYSDAIPQSDLGAPAGMPLTRADLAQGRLSNTGNPLDLAISGSGMFRLRSADGTFVYSRSGQFKLADGGRVVNAQGLSPQTVDGGDLVVPNGEVRVLADGTVLDKDRPIAKIGIYKPTTGVDVRPIGGSLFTVPEDLVEAVSTPELRQGMVEASNVSLADEMVTMMDALRQAEGGARLVQIYDDLMGKAVSTFGQGVR